MSKFHINGQGEPGKCNAKISCPFGDLDSDHYASEKAARKAYESRMKKATFNETPMTFQPITIDELKEVRLTESQRKQLTHQDLETLQTIKNGYEKEVNSLDLMYLRTSLAQIGIMGKTPEVDPNEFNPEKLEAFYKRYPARRPRILDAEVADGYRPKIWSGWEEKGRRSANVELPDNACPTGDLEPGMTFQRAIDKTSTVYTVTKKPTLMGIHTDRGLIELSRSANHAGVVYLVEKDS